MKYIALLLFACSTLCLAKTRENTTNTAGCPISIHKVNLNTAYSPEFRMFYANTSTKMMLGTKFGVDVMDPTGDYVPSNDVADTHKNNPGKGSAPLFRVESLNNHPSGLRIYLKKVAFDDGTTWEDDGTMACRIVEDYR